MLTHRSYRQTHSSGRFGHALHVEHRPEEAQLLVLPPVHLQAFEQLWERSFSIAAVCLILRTTSRTCLPYLNAVVQRRTGRVHRQVPEGLDARRPPALGFAPLDGQHVVGEDRPEGLRLRAGGFETFGAQLDSQVGCLDGGGMQQL